MEKLLNTLILHTGIAMVISWNLELLTGFKLVLGFDFVQFLVDIVGSGTVGSLGRLGYFN